MFYCLPDALEIHGRLFDHRPVLQGHISNFVKEFEVRKLDLDHGTVFYIYLRNKETQQAC